MTTMENLTMTTTSKNRAAYWAAWNSMTPGERAEVGIVTVTSRDGTEVGYATDEADEGCLCGSPRSVTLEVIWRDGEATMCCTCGMESQGDDDERMPGGCVAWTIR